jgi:hypothetical protein
MKRKKSTLEIHHRFVVGTVSPLERAHRDDFNISAKGCKTTPKETAHTIKVMTQKANQTKYHEISTLFLC